MLTNQRAGMAFIFVTLLIDILGFGLVIPVMPQLVSRLAGGGPSAGAHVYGLLLASFGLMQFLCSPILGSLSDQFGRRPVLLLSMFFSMVDFVIMALAPSMPWLFAGRILSGITSASFTAASAYIADVSPPDKRAQNFGMVGAAFGIGFILGPATGGLLGGISLRAPFWAAAALSLVNFLYGLFVLPESLAPESRRPFSRTSFNPLKGLQILSRYRWVLAMSVSIALLALAQQSLQSTWVLYTQYRFKWTPLQNGLSLALIGLMSGVVQMGLTRTLTPRLGDRRAILLGLAFNFAGFLAFALVTRGWMMIPVLIVWSVSGIAGPTTQSLMSRQYGSNEQGAVQGALSSLQSLMGIVAPIIATGVFGYFTRPDVKVRLPGSPFLLGAALIALSAIIAREALKHGTTAEAKSAVGV